MTPPSLASRPVGQRKDNREISASSAHGGSHERVLPPGREDDGRGSVARLMGRCGADLLDIGHPVSRYEDIAPALLLKECERLTAVFVRSKLVAHFCGVHVHRDRR